MTIVNVALGEREVAIITDSRTCLITDDRPPVKVPYLAQKCLALPNFGMLVAFTGSEMFPIVEQWHNYLFNGVLLETDVDGIAQNCAADLLTDICRRLEWNNEGCIIHAGIAGGWAGAYIHTAPHWFPKPIPVGTWCSPSRPSYSNRVECAVAPPPFLDSLSTIRRRVVEQHRINPVSCGGSIMESYIDSGMVVRQQVIRVLE